MLFALVGNNICQDFPLLNIISFVVAEGEIMSLRRDFSRIALLACRAARRGEFVGHYLSSLNPRSVSISDSRMIPYFFPSHSCCLSPPYPALVSKSYSRESIAGKGDGCRKLPWVKRY